MDREEGVGDGEGGIQLRMVVVVGNLIPAPLRVSVSMQWWRLKNFKNVD